MHDRGGKLAVLCLNKEGKFPQEFQLYAEFKEGPGNYTTQQT